MGRGRGRHRVGPTRGERIRRAAGVMVACAVVALALAVFGQGYLGWSTAQADQRFVAAVRAEGRTVEPGETEALVIRAAHKLCQRRDGTTYSQRRDATLSADEIDAVRRTFGDDDRAFTKVALRTYCS
jgi:hypothetical protein